ncbi:MAG TPA: sulfatase, partial [Planctomycetota bacterium]|nr:sulfatase [Planctomycetota bacterium]
YGCDWTKMPNFQRLGAHSITFDNSYVGSMPCMPARRELHTGRYNFMHRSWGPLEPFDDSMPQLLGQNNIHTHLASDHYHYWEDGGANYHCRYRTWEFFRGQEGDPWIGQVKDPVIPPTYQTHKGNKWRQDWINRPYTNTVETSPQGKTFRAGCEYIERNHAEDNWFLQIETFDPHEPYFVPEKYKKMYGISDEGLHWDWPSYGRFPDLDPKMRDKLRKTYAALMAMCDDHLGQVLDLMDKYKLWQDTLLIVNTDHGILLGEKDLWQKSVMPYYDEVAHTPLFIWDPRCGRQNERRQSLVQTMDLPATILEYFNVARPADMQGVPLRQTIADDIPVRSAALFGIFGGHMNVTDGRYVYMRAPASAQNGPLFQYTQMSGHAASQFSLEESRSMTAHAGFSFTKGCPVMKIKPGKSIGNRAKAFEFGTLLFDLKNDPQELNPLHDPALEARMTGLMVELMKASDAPAEQYERLGLPAPA